MILRDDHEALFLNILMVKLKLILKLNANLSKI